MDKLKLIKGIVIILGALIVIGIAAAILGIMNKNDKPALAFPTRESLVTTSPSDTSTVLITEPKGSKIAEVTGCGDNICLLIEGGNKGRRVAILSAKGNLIRKVILSEPKKEKQSNK